MFTIIMPIYNVRKDYLYAAFDSISRQTYRNFELIIVIDGANKETSTAIREYNFKGINTTIISQENKGQYISRINGLKKAKGDYIFFFDSDDLLTKNALLILNNLIIKYRSDVIIYSLPRFYNDESDMVEVPHFFEEGVIEKDTVIDELLKLHSNNICSKCAKGDLLSTETSFVDEKLRNGEDLGQATRLILSADSFYYTKENIYLYRDNQESREYYDTRNIHNVNFPVPMYRDIFINNSQYEDKKPLFKASVINSVIRDSFLICRFNKNKKEKYLLLDELNKQEIVKILKSLNCKAPLLSEFVFSLLTNRFYSLLNLLAYIYPVK